MTFIPLNDIAKAIAAIDADAALCGALKAQLQSLAPNFIAQFSTHNRLREQTPFPNPATITAAQMSVFDNWIEHGGKRPRRGEPGHYRDRFKVTLDLWTTHIEKLDLKNDRPGFSVTSHLWSGDEILKRANQRNGNLRLPKVLSPSFREHLVSNAQRMGPDARLGLVYTDLGRSLVYHDGVSIVVADDLASHDVGMIGVSGPAGHFVFDGFTPTSSKGGKLATNCIAHSRMTTSPKLAEAWNAKLIEGTE